MNIRNIKSESEFYEMADIWYQRAHKLREVWMGELGTDRSLKAYKIWLKLFVRLQHCAQTAIKFSQHPMPDKVKKGGVVQYATDFNDPAFLRGEAVIKAEPKFRS